MISSTGRRLNPLPTSSPCGSLPRSWESRRTRCTAPSAVASSPRSASGGGFLVGKTALIRFFEGTCESATLPMNGQEHVR